MYTYHSLKELFDLADKAECSPGIIACRAEAEESEKSCEEVWNRMKRRFLYSGMQFVRDCLIQENRQAASSEEMQAVSITGRCVS